MKQVRTWFSVFLAALCLFLDGPSAQAQGATHVSLIATQTSAPGGAAIYRYRVVNNGTLPIVAVMVGADYFHGTSELSVFPTGWTLDAGAPAGVIGAPAAWTGQVLTTEDDAFFQVEWRNDGTHDVAAGTSQGGFSVFVPSTDVGYVSSHWTAIFADATAESGSILVSGSPRIAVKVLSSTQTSPGIWSIAAQVTNIGTDAASTLSIDRLVFKTLSGQGTVTASAPTLPAALASLVAGANKTVTFVVNVPTTVKKYSIAQVGSLVTAAGSSVSFSSAQVVYPKN